MADTVTTVQVYAGPKRKVTQLTNRSDGTGETNVVKIDISAFTNSNGAVATYMAIDYIEFSVWGFNYVTLAFDHTTDDVMAVLSGNGYLDYAYIGGFIDPRSTGGTGDLLLSTDGTVVDSGYDIVLHWRPKA